MKIYETRTAPNARRVRMFLAEKGIDDVEYIQVDIEKGENITPEFRQKNPVAKIPVLEYEAGQFLSESVAICRYFELLHPEPRLMGTTSLEQAKIEQWQRWCEMYFMYPVGMSFQHTTGYYKDRMTPVAEWGKVCWQDAANFMNLLNSHLSDSEFVAGDSFSIADITTFVALEFARVIKLRVSYEQVHLKGWYENIKQRPSASA